MHDNSSQGMIKVLTVMPGQHPPIPNLNTHPLSNTGPIITELSTDDRHDDSSDFNDNDSNVSRTMNRTNSMASNKMSTRLTRQLSFSAKSTESPSLPKRNQPITSSAPSTLTKKGLEEENEKKEIYV